jgi:hypothetical protein
MPKTWKAVREPEPAQRRPASEEVQPPVPAARPIPEVVQESADDLDVPTFLRRQAQKA